MSSQAQAKLPPIEHVKDRKNGLDVLSDIYRYAELGFDAIEPDDLALFRWYGVYTQRAEESAASIDPGPSEDTDGYFMLRVKFPGGRSAPISCARSAGSQSAMAAAWAISPRARTSSCTGSRSRTCRWCWTS